MKPAPFRYIAARSLEQALALKAEHGDEARFLAGGQSLVPTMNFRLTQPAVLIDINPLTQLAGMQKSGPESVHIGALTRYRDLERDAATARDLPLVAEALPHIAHPQIRNRGTIGGNLAHADPASEMPAIVVALAGQLRAQSTRGERWIAAAEFFAGALATTLAADEMLVEIKLPAAKPRSGACFMEVARRFRPHRRGLHGGHRRRRTMRRSADRPLQRRRQTDPGRRRRRLTRRPADEHGADR
jgi:CO/xanthine dehydrogenase FAD-binding subunit